MVSSLTFHLSVKRLEQICFFELSWGQGLRLSATLEFPSELLKWYREWQQAYLSFYKTAQICLTQAESDSPMRGRLVDKGVGTAPLTDPHARLVDTETKLLYEFNRWLRRGELYEIRTQLSTASSQFDRPDNQSLDLFLTCTPELARFPWEGWELNTGRKVRIARAPETIRAEIATAKPRRHRPRILAILGDERGLDFQADRAAIRSLANLAEVRFMGWQPGQPIDQLKTQISQAIADEQGWDVLFFAGHSNETQMTGGGLGIAPNASIQISEIAPQLQMAKERGLQFAIFNSCSGLKIAESLINLGLSQVAVMREPIHNRVAQEFLIQFLQNLAKHQDVHECLIAACQWLKAERQFTYPSAYLIPSLFRHPDSTLFQIERSGWKQWWTLWRPKRYEAFALAALAVLTILPIRSALLQHRVRMQAVYRAAVQPAPDAIPPVLLVQIDDESIQRAGISNPRYMDRGYLAQLVEQLAVRNARVIGIDYLLDYQQEQNDQRLALAIQTAMQQGRWLVLGTTWDNEGNWYTLSQGIEESGGLKGDMGLWGRGRWEDGNYITQLSLTDAPLPLSYILAQLYLSGVLPTDASAPLQRSFLSKSPCDDLSSRMCFHWVSALADAIGQRWLYPIVDYSIPPSQVYSRISAWKVSEPSELESSGTALIELISQQIVIIAPGGYADAGVGPGEDNFTPPEAMKHWYSRENSVASGRLMTGGEVHAYMVHHHLTQRFVIPIPDLWLIGIAAIAGKGTALLIQRQSSRQFTSRQQNRARHQWQIGLLLMGGTVVYALVSFQLYASSVAILLPIVLPTTAFGLYVLPLFIKRRT